jgi:hypothetical protein
MKSMMFLTRDVCNEAGLSKGTLVGVGSGVGVITTVEFAVGIGVDDPVQAVNTITIERTVQNAVFVNFIRNNPIQRDLYQPSLSLQLDHQP